MKKQENVLVEFNKASLPGAKKTNFLIYIFKHTFVADSHYSLFILDSNKIIFFLVKYLFSDSNFCRSKYIT